MICISKLPYPKIHIILYCEQLIKNRVQFSYAWYKHNTIRSVFLNHSQHLSKYKVEINMTF